MFILVVFFHVYQFTIQYTSIVRKAPDQNRTDTRSLEGYCSTIELQAHEKRCIMRERLFFCKRNQ